MVTFLQNSQDLWFDQTGDGKTPRPFDKYNLTPPDGCLCDAARPGLFVAKQGDGRVNIHDWAMEFTAAGLLMQAEAVLINRDAGALKHYLPKLERCANFIETRRDPRMRGNSRFTTFGGGNDAAPQPHLRGVWGERSLRGLCRWRHPPARRCQNQVHRAILAAAFHVDYQVK